MKGFLLWSEIFVIMRKHTENVSGAYVNSDTLKTLKIFPSNLNHPAKAAAATYSKREEVYTKGSSI